MVRLYTVAPAAKAIERNRGSAKSWKGLIKTFISVERTGSDRTERQVYACNKHITAQKAESLIRNHWKVENKLHLVLDVVLREDAQKKSKSTQARALINALAYNLLRRQAPEGGWKEVMVSNCQNMLNMLTIKGLR